MNKKSLIFLTGITLLTLGYAFFSIVKPNYSSTSAAQTAVMPQLAKELDTITQVIIETADQTTVISRNEQNDWQMDSKHQYPVQQSVIRETLLNFANAQILAPMTKDPQKLGLLGLGDASPELKKVTFKGLSSPDTLYIGRQVTLNTPSNNMQVSEFYVRYPKDSQGLHVKGDLSLPRSHIDWLDFDHVAIPKDQIKSVILTHQDGEEIRLRQAPDLGTGFTLKNLPEGRKEKYQFVGNQIAFALHEATFLDVAPFNPSQSTPISSIQFHLLDESTTTVNVVKKDEKYWITLHKSQESTQDKTSPQWLYSVTSLTSSSLTKRMEDLLEPQPKDENSDTK